MAPITRTNIAAISTTAPEWIGFPSGSQRLIRSRIDGNAGMPVTHFARARSSQFDVTADIPVLDRDGSSPRASEADFEPPDFGGAGSAAPFGSLLGGAGERESSADTSRARLRYLDGTFSLESTRCRSP